MPQDTQNLATYLRSYFVDNGMDPEWALFLNLCINILVLAVFIYAIFYVTKKLVVKTFKAFSSRTKTNFDDFLIQSNFPKYISNIIPLILLIITIPVIFDGYPRVLFGFEKLSNIYLIILVVLIIRSILRTSKNYLSTKDRFKDKPVQSYVQVVMIFAWFIGFIFIFSELTGRSVANFLLSLGAASAIILLIFKDTILGFVASIQVSVNDIVRIGDWITFSKYGADGFVTEINLATVRIQNWDKTYTTIPTYYLISDSFQNWRGMQESPGRRIKRSLFIKQSSVKFVTNEDLERFSKFSLIKPYINERQEIINEFNRTHNFDRSSVINGRNQTNLGIFRKYVDNYLHQHPLISKELFIMARLLSPTVHGIPLEIYCFTSDKRWVYHEDINADIFEHLIAALPYFDLKLFEEPSGDDIISVSKHLVSNPS